MLHPFSHYVESNSLFFWAKVPSLCFCLFKRCSLHTCLPKLIYYYRYLIIQALWCAWWHQVSLPANFVLLWNLLICEEGFAMWYSFSWCGFLQSLKLAILESTLHKVWDTIYLCVGWIWWVNESIFNITTMLSFFNMYQWWFLVSGLVDLNESWPLIVWSSIFNNSMLFFFFFVNLLYHMRQSFRNIQCFCLSVGQGYLWRWLLMLIGNSFDIICYT